MNVYKLNKNTHIITLEECTSMNDTYVNFQNRDSFGLLKRTKKGINTKNERYFKKWEDAVKARTQIIKMCISHNENRIEKLKKRLEEIPQKPKTFGAVDGSYLLTCTICEKDERVNPSACSSAEKKEFICIECVEYERKRLMKKTTYTSEDINQAVHLVKFGKLSIVTRSAKRGGRYLLTLKQDERKKITGKLCSDQYLKELFEL